MFRQMLRLAVEAVKVEIELWKNPTGVEPEPMPAPVPVAVAEPPPVPKAVSKWSSTAFHMEALRSTSCPDCGATKKVGSYRCVTCASEAAVRRG